MSKELIPPERPYDLAEAQEFLGTVGQFDQKDLDPNLSQKLLGLQFVWRFVDRLIAGHQADNPFNVVERLYSGFTATSQYFEVHGNPTRLTGSPVYAFQADLAVTGGITVHEPRVQKGREHVQLHFGTVFRDIMVSPPETGRDPSAPCLQLGTHQEMSADGFFYYVPDPHTSNRRFVLVDTLAYQYHTGLYGNQPREGLYHPDPPFSPSN